MNYIGIDPGINGAYCIISEDEIKVHSFGEKWDIFREATRYPYLSRIWIERVWSSPNQSVQSAFTFGENYGYWKGLIDSTESEYEEITPYEWQSKFISNFSSKSYKHKKKDLYHLCLKELEKHNFSIKVNQKQADAVLIALALKKHIEDVTNSDQLKEQHIPRWGRPDRDCL